MNEASNEQRGVLALTSQEAAAVARVLHQILDGQSPGADPEGPETTNRPSDFVPLAKNILSARRLRTTFLSPSLVGEPAWDMLLVLYVQPGGVPVTDVVEQSGAASTTALRWLEHLRDRDLVEKTRSSVDRRIWLVSISEKGRVALDRYFSSLPLELRDGG